MNRTILLMLGALGWWMKAGAADAQVLQVAPVSDAFVTAKSLSSTLGGEGGATVSPQYPWCSTTGVPTPDELKALMAARKVAAADAVVIAASQNYAKSFAVADESIRALMLKSPLSAPYIEQIKRHQQVHETVWLVDRKNNPDILLPDADPEQKDAERIERVKFSGSAGDRVVPPDSVDGIRRTVLQEAGAAAALQNVREAYRELNAAVKTVMWRNPDVQFLLIKYPDLLYGRQDLGLVEGPTTQI